MLSNTYATSLLNLIRSLKTSVGISIAVVVVGLFVIFVQFYIMHSNSVSYTNRSIEQGTGQAIAKLQQQIDGMRNTLGMVATLYSANPNTIPEQIPSLIAVTGGKADITLAMYLNVLDGNNNIKSDVILPSNAPEHVHFAPNNLVGFVSSVQKVAASSRASSVVLPDAQNAKQLWLVIMRPVISTNNKMVVAGFVPLKKMLSGLESIYQTADTAHLEIEEDSGSSQQTLFNLRKELLADGLLKLQTHEDKVRLDDRIWRITFSALPQESDIANIVLPYTMLAMGLLLIVAMSMHLSAMRRREREATLLAHALQSANAELKEKVTAVENISSALYDSESRYKAVFDNMGVGIFQISRSGELLEANTTTASILGYDGAQELLEAQSEPRYRMFADMPEKEAWFASVVETPQRNQEMCLLQKDGEAIWVNLSSHAVYGRDGEVKSFSCSMYDVTARHQATEDLRLAKEQAEIANRSKSEFLAGISHELRTPLNAIIGFSEIIMNQMFGSAGQPQYVEYSRDIHDAGQLLLSLINDILDMAKVDAGKRTLAESSINLERVILAVVRMMSVRAKSGKLHLNVNMPRQLPDIHGEEKAIKQVLTNLLSNAIKFTPDGGTVTLSAEIDNQNRMVLRVEDTGVGIADKDIATALSAFGQVENPLSGKNQGTGLGLPLSNALVELHGGTMVLTSEVGRGTVVTITFPPERTVSLKG